MADHVKDAALRAHNKLRALHGAPALVWDETCHETALEWAQKCASSGRVEHGGCDGMGQNVVFLPGDAHDPAAAACTEWYGLGAYMKISFTAAGMAEYDLAGFGPSTAAFTQLLWRDTTAMGLASITTPHGTVVVAHYVPPGNEANKYRLNVKPPLNSKAPLAKTPTPSRAAAADKPLAGRIYHADVTNASTLSDFLYHRGDYNAVVTGGYPIVGVVVFLAALILIGVGVKLQFWPLNFAAFLAMIIVAFCMLIFLHRMMNDFYLVHWVKYRPLHVAAHRRRKDICELLIRAGADASVRDSYHRTAADIAMDILADEEIVEMLLQAHRKAVMEGSEDAVLLDKQLAETSANLQAMRAFNEI